MDRLSLTDQFVDLRSISDNVEDYLSRELYVDSFGYDSDYTPNDILRECYTIILQELRELGITFTAEIDDLLGDWYTAKHLYYIREIADAYSLKEICRDEDVKNKLDTLLQAPEESDDLFVALVTYLHEKHPTELRYRYAVEFSDILVASERFDQHVKCILAASNDYDAIATPDVKLAQSYIKKIQDIRNLVKTTVETIISSLQLQTSLSNTKMNKLLDEYDLDKIAPKNLKLFSIIDNEAAKELYPNLNKLRAVEMQKHKERASHHIEYWFKHSDLHPTKEDLILLVAHHNEPGVTPDKFNSEIATMLALGEKIFTPDDAEFIASAANSVTAILNNQPVDMEEGN